MSWDAIGALAELVGAAAVVATLAYLAVQVRQNTKAMEESRKVELSRNYQQLTQLRSDMMLHVSGSQELAEIYVKVKEQGVAALTPVEFLRVQRREQVNLNVNASSFYQYELGLIDQRQFELGKRVFEMNRRFWESLDIDIGDHLAWIERLEHDNC